MESLADVPFPHPHPFHSLPHLGSQHNCVTTNQRAMSYRFWGSITRHFSHKWLSELAKKFLKSWNFLPPSPLNLCKQEKPSFTPSPSPESPSLSPWLLFEHTWTNCCLGHLFQRISIIIIYGL